MEVITYTTQYVGKKTECPHCHKTYMPKFPNNVKNTINYDEKIKTTIVYLNTYCNVPNRKSTELLKFFSEEKINMAPATITNTIASFSRKSKPILENMKREILKSPVINEDESPIMVNGKIMSAIGVFTNKISLTEAFANRKLESFEEMGILDKYIGTVCHDHNPMHKNFIQSTQEECNFHILRYCKGEYEEAKQKYLRILDKWDKEYLEKANKDTPQYYQSERCLKKRLRECSEDHLRFLTDFRIDFTNNLAERGLRKIKGKLKVAGTFRSLGYAKHYCNAISIIDTCKKQNVNIGNAIKDIFMGKKKIFAF